MYDSNQTPISPDKGNSKTTDAQGYAYFNRNNNSTVKHGFRAHKSTYEHRSHLTLVDGGTAQQMYVITLRPRSDFTSLGFVSPVSSYTPPTMSPGVSQNFGWRYNGGLVFHQGIDLSRFSNGNSYSTTTPVYNMSGGYHRSDYSSGPNGMGHWIQTKATVGGADYYIIYMHLTSYDTTKTTKGNIIGYVGATPNVALHLHVHIGVNSDSVAISPLSNYLDPNVFF